jgi:hypothetical protein
MARRPSPELLERARKAAQSAARAADRAARARAARPPRDPTGRHHATIGDVAQRTGRDVDELLDLWDERAAIREYDGAASRADAEREAAAEVEQMFAPRQAALPWE